MDLVPDSQERDELVGTMRDVVHELLTDSIPGLRETTCNRLSKELAIFFRHQLRTLKHDDFIENIEE